MPALLPSELPLRVRVRHHWIVMFRPPHWLLSIAFGLLLVSAVVTPRTMAVPFAIVFAAFAFLRWQTWNAEQILVTRSRIIRVRGVPESTTTESSLRLDRISGAVLEQTVLGKILGYGTVELEAPGSHPDVRKLERIEHPHRFYLALREVVFGDGLAPDPVDSPQAHVTAPLPRLRHGNGHGQRHTHGHGRPGR